MPKVAEPALLVQALQGDLEVLLLQVSGTPRVVAETAASAGTARALKVVVEAVALLGQMALELRAARPLTGAGTAR